MNGLVPLYAAALLDKPMLDADCMGRAYPMIQMTLPFILRSKTTPAAFSDEKGHHVYCVEVGTSINPTGIGKGIEQIKVDPTRIESMERAARDFAIQNGLYVGIGFRPLDKEAIETQCIKYSVSRAWRLGRAILEARKKHTSPLKAIEEREGGRLQFQGKITHLERGEKGGFSCGEILIEGFGPF